MCIYLILQQLLHMLTEWTLILGATANFLVQDALQVSSDSHWKKEKEKVILHQFFQKNHKPGVHTIKMFTLFTFNERRRRVLTKPVGRCSSRPSCVIRYKLQKKRHAPKTTFPKSKGRRQTNVRPCVRQAPSVSPPVIFVRMRFSAAWILTISFFYIF